MLWLNNGFISKTIFHKALKHKNSDFLDLIKFSTTKGFLTNTISVKI